MPSLGDARPRPYRANGGSKPASAWCSGIRHDGQRVKQPKNEFVTKALPKLERASLSHNIDRGCGIMAGQPKTGT
jgi:hypothetical protein